MSLCSEGLMKGRIFASEIWGAYFRDGLFFFVGRGGGGLIIEILRYINDSPVPWYMSINF